MPQDVPLGQGYSGDALLSAFPGQYRDEARPQVNPSTYLPQPPGAASGRPSYADPDNGRALRLIEMPGVGQVVVPVEHTMVGVGSVVPVEHTMVGVDAIGCSVDRENLSGLGHHQVCAWGVNKIGKAAGAAAHEALALVKQGKIRSAGEAQAHVQARTEKVGSAVIARLQDRIPKVPVVVKQAASQAWDAVKPHITSLLSSDRKMGHHPQEDLSGMDASIWGKPRPWNWVQGLTAAARAGAQAALQLAHAGPTGMAFKAQANPRDIAQQLLNTYITRAVNAYIAAAVDRGQPPASVVKQVIRETILAWLPKTAEVVNQSRFMRAPRPVTPLPAGPVGVRGGL